MRKWIVSAVLLLCGALSGQRADGLYAEIRTSKGLIVARLEPGLTPVAVASFVGLAEGTIANAAFEPGRPFFDGAVYHRVAPGHVIQTAYRNRIAPRVRAIRSQRVHARLSHNHAGALNMANSGPRRIPRSSASRWATGPTWMAISPYSARWWKAWIR